MFSALVIGLFRKITSARPLGPERHTQSQRRSSGVFSTWQDCECYVIVSVRCRLVVVHFATTMYRPIAVAIGLFLFSIPNVFGDLLAIDYGTDWTKALLVRSGEPDQVLLYDGKEANMYASVAMNHTRLLFDEEALDAVCNYCCP